MAAFSEGFDGRIVPPNRLLEGTAAMYGILRGTGELIHQCKWVRRDFYYVDHGYFKRGHFEGNYRITKNALQNENPIIRPDDRFRSLDLDVRPWNRSGRHVLVIPLTPAVGHFLDIDPSEWESAVVQELCNNTSRPIIVKPDKKESLDKYLSNCWCVVTHSSNTAIVALLNGIPVITLGESAASPCSWDFKNIEAPDWVDNREPLFHHLAYNQFTLEEIRDGTARKLLE